MRRIRSMRPPAKIHERRSRKVNPRDRDRGLERLFQLTATNPPDAAQRRAGAIAGGSPGAASSGAGGSRRGSTTRAALTLRQSAFLRGLWQTLLRIALERRLRRNRSGLLVRPRISRETNLDPREVGHVRPG